MKHNALKSQINTAASTATGQRREATRLIVEGRQLRREGRALGAEKPDPDERGSQLLKQGWDNHTAGMELLYDAELCRPDRRHMHLAAALLNGRTYLRCESSINEQKTGKASANAIAQHIRLHLPDEDRPQAEAIAREWVEKGTVRLRYDKETNRVQLQAAEPLKEAA